MGVPTVALRALLKLRLSLNGTPSGLQTLSEMRRRYSALYRKVLRRGKINTETEYYLVNGLVVDQSSTLTTEERTLLQDIVSAYEG